MAVVVPVGSDDLNRVDANTRVITVSMPNTQAANGTFWGQYRISVDSLETLTGYDFLSEVPAAVQSVIEASADTGPTQ
jgi:endonuclease G